MTHTLHRMGDEQTLKNDYIFLCTPAKGINNAGAREKLIKMLDILLEAGPINIGFYGHGSKIEDIDFDEVKRCMHDNSRLRCCFDDKEKLKAALKKIKEGNFGLSITVSGLISELLDISNDLSLKPHTVNIACGVYGKVEYLPGEQIREITTMCGHGMIGFKLTEETIGKLKRREIEMEKAIGILQKPCTCGIFNPTRAREILQKILFEEEEKKAILQRRKEREKLQRDVEIESIEATVND